MSAPATRAIARSASSLVIAAGLAVLVGCAPSYRHYGYHGYHHHHRSGISTGGAIAAGLIAGVAIASLARGPERPPPRTAVYVYQAPPRTVVVAPPPAPPPPRADEPPPLDPAATRAAFADVDVSECNAPRVYGHAKISLNPDGRISRVVVEDPADLEPLVAQCIGRKIGQVTVPPFRGGMVVLGTTFRVH